MTPLRTPGTVSKRVKSRATTWGFTVGLLLGLLFIGYRMFKYSGGLRSEELSIYLAIVLAFALAGVLISGAISWIVQKGGKRK